jgi:putative ABC transport system permease protein
MAGPLNWLAQVASVTWFGILAIPQRLGSVLAAVVGIAGVAAVMLSLLSISAGFQKAMNASASPDDAIVLRSGADSEMVSGISRDNSRVIADAPGLARDPTGPLSSAELFVIINLPMRSRDSEANVPMRGVEPAAFKVRDHFKIIQGRQFQWGRNEIMVGSGAARQFKGLECGRTLVVGRNEWPIVGVFSAGGGVAESEIWMDATVLQQIYHRGDTFQSVYTKLSSTASFNQFKDSLTTNPQLSVQVLRQSDYYASQSTQMTRLITTLGYLITFLMGLGAVFVALNTMYSAVAARTREIATLRALGFGGGSVVTSVILEALLLGLAGGAVGASIAYFCFNGFQTATVNFQSFSQVTFSFDVTSRLLVQGVVLSALIGLVGGLPPAIRALRLPIAAALREL